MLAGIFFLIPIGIALFIGIKVFNWIRRPLKPFNERFAGDDFLARLFLDIIVLIILVLICVVAGIIARTKLALSAVSKLERMLLSKLPGYEFLRNMAETSTGVRKEEQKVVLAKIDDGWQLGFIVDEVDSTHLSIYIPDCPSALSGSLYFMPVDFVIKVEITQRQAIRCIRKVGVGSGDLLRGRVMDPVWAAAAEKYHS